MHDSIDLANHRLLLINLCDFIDYDKIEQYDRDTSTRESINSSIDTITNAHSIAFMSHRHSITGVDNIRVLRIL